MSSTLTAISLREATLFAQRLVADLRPHCTRIEVAGSIRRHKPWVHDIEIVMTPRTELVSEEVVPADMFTPAKTRMVPVRCRGYEDVVRAYAHTVVRGRDIATAKYTQIVCAEDIKVDLFTAVPENWGYILAIRTGSAEYSKALASRWVALGYKGDGGMLTRAGQVVPVREEHDLFELIGLKWIPPTDRG